MDMRSRKIIAALSALLIIAIALILALVIRGRGNVETVNSSSTGTIQTNSVANTVKTVTTSTTASQTVNNSNTASTQSVPSNPPGSNTDNGTLPNAVGESSITTIVDIGSRLVGAPNSGTAIKYANGGYQVSYDISASTSDWHVGDRVKLYLESLPTGCPPGDNRGKLYQATNLRTNETWEAYDSEHMCGGA